MTQTRRTQITLLCSLLAGGTACESPADPVTGDGDLVAEVSLSADTLFRGRTLYVTVSVANVSSRVVGYSANDCPLGIYLSTDGGLKYLVTVAICQSFARHVQLQPGKSRTYTYAWTGLANEVGHVDRQAVPPGLYSLEVAFSATEFSIDAAPVPIVVAEAPL